MKEAVLFDLGNTLAHYFERSEFPALLEEAVLAARAYLEEAGLLHVPAEMMWQRVREEDHEAEDYRVRPLEGRLLRIFELDPAPAAEVREALCRHFSRPLLARGRCYEDSLPVLRQLKAARLKTALVSNTPWGSPAALWREELGRLGLAPWLDLALFCTDVGWRKPARPILALALERLQVDRRQCLLVGDDPRWDLAAARAIGMDAILIDRHGTGPAGERSIRTLYDLWGQLQPGVGRGACDLGSHDL